MCWWHLHPSSACSSAHVLQHSGIGLEGGLICWAGCCFFTIFGTSLGRVSVEPCSYKKAVQGCVEMSVLPLLGSFSAVHDFWGGVHLYRSTGPSGVAN